MNEVPPIRAPRAAWLWRPFLRFFEMEAAGGLMLLAVAVLALAWANSPWRASYEALWHTYIAVGIPESAWYLKLSLHHWINDGLMAIFFLLVGLEIKREVLIGELASPRKAALPIVAALGGMVVPAGIFAALNWGGEGIGGWGIPMATDIAFAVGVLALAGRRAPLSLKVFLLAVAIVDDLGAVLVIALFYTTGVSWGALGAAAGFLVLLIGLNRLSIHRPWPYMVLGAALWLAMYQSGVHATIAGVLLAMTIPASRRIEEQQFLDYGRSLLDRFGQDVPDTPEKLTEDQEGAVHYLEQACEAVQTPLARVEHALLWPSNFVIVPLFALANAGVAIEGGIGEAVTSAVTLGTALGLVIGKPVGVLLFAFAAVKLGLAAMPEGATWRQTAAVACLCGIGFTMSLFIAILAYPERPDLLDEAKLGVLGASLLMGMAGLGILFMQPEMATQAEDLTDEG